MISEYIATLLLLLMSYPFQPSTLKVKGRGFQGRGRGLLFHTLGLPLVYPSNGGSEGLGDFYIRVSVLRVQFC